MGRLEVHISHGHGPDLSGIVTLAVLGFAVTVAAEVIASVIWWFVAITAVTAVTVPAAGVLTWRATRRREARFAALLAARRAAIPAPLTAAGEALAPPPNLRDAPYRPAVHLHFHGINPAELTGLALPADDHQHPGRTS